MNRRDFLASAGLVPALASAQQGVSSDPPVMRMTAGPAPTIALNHLGFTPKARKLLIVRLTGRTAPPQFTIRDISFPLKPFSLTLPLKPAPRGDFGDHLIGDFTELERAGQYRIFLPDEHSVPFFVRDDAWRRTLPKPVSYFHAQRCGVEVPNVHPACHLDDARRRDNGQHLDVTGGWHDAGDVRKGMSQTMANGFGLMHLARNLGEKWDLVGSGLKVLLDEMRWGNTYFLKMQDTDGLVWGGTEGEAGGNNTGNNWTDNQIGTADDRFIIWRKSGNVQANWVTLQAMVAQAFQAADASYAQRCLEAGLRCRRAAGVPSGPGENAGELAWWTLADLELWRATQQVSWADSAAAMAGRLLALQATDYVGSQKSIRGFWPMGRTAGAPDAPGAGPGGRYPGAASFQNDAHSAVPGHAMMELIEAFPKHPDAQKWREAMRMHLEEFVVPLCGRSVYRIMPSGLFFGSPTKEHYRPLEGELTYRYFMPARADGQWQGLTAHLESWAFMLAKAARAFERPEYRDLAWRQMEWVMGANPFGACLMTGEGARNPYPLSYFVGVIVGGLMNGVAGNADDEPILNFDGGIDWHTNEYWSPHVGYYLAAVSELETGGRG
ncbi:MAG TPA: glycoside hydrolase family 9 protein [Bryobacteraceae bacterium]|nr:glycoside hydrolase family 9 protein [Bryobacteraceae bacterium]